MSSRHPGSGRTFTDRRALPATLALGVLGAAWALFGGAGCASYSSERAQFESRRMTVHAVNEPAPSRSSARMASARDRE